MNNFAEEDLVMVYLAFLICISLTSPVLSWDSDEMDLFDLVEVCIIYYQTRASL